MQREYLTSKDEFEIVNSAVFRLLVSNEAARLLLWKVSAVKVFLYLSQYLQKEVKKFRGKQQLNVLGNKKE